MRMESSARRSTKNCFSKKLEVIKGFIMENIVAQMLVASGHKLYFYYNASRDDASSRMEIDLSDRQKQDQQPPQYLTDRGEVQ